MNRVMIQIFSQWVVLNSGVLFTRVFEALVPDES